MTSPEHQKFNQVKSGSDKNFGLVFAFVFCLLGIWPLLSGSALKLEFLAIGIFFVAISFIQPSLLTPLNKLWFKLGLLLEKIVSPLIMLIIFFVIFLPISMLVKICGKDLLNQKMKPGQKTYWITPEEEESSMKNQF